MFFKIYCNRQAGLCFNLSHYTKYFRQPSSHLIRRGLSAFTDNKINVTFAIDKPVYEELKQEADAQNTSLNAKVNHIMDMYIKFYRIAARFESKTIPHQQFGAMLELMEERGLIKILIDIGNHDIMSSFHQNEIPFTIDSLIKNCFEGVALWTGFCA